MDRSHFPLESIYMAMAAYVQDQDVFCPWTLISASCGTANKMALLSQDGRRCMVAQILKAQDLRPIGPDHMNRCDVVVAFYILPQQSVGSKGIMTRKID